MSVSHHGTEPELPEMTKKTMAEIQRRFIDEVEGRAERRWPKGRVSPDDDGELTFAIAIDHSNQMIRIEFSKATEWIGLGLKEAIMLHDKLNQCIEDLAMRPEDL